MTKQIPVNCILHNRQFPEVSGCMCVLIMSLIIIIFQNISIHILWLQHLLTTTNKQTNKTKQNTAGLGVFAGTSFKYGEQLGRVGDAAFPTVDHDWHNSPESGSLSKHEADYHWPLTNYDWNAPDIGMENEAEDVSVTVIGFGGKIIMYMCILF